MAARYLIVPGLNGSAAGHWQHWWLRDHADAVLVGQDDWGQPDDRQWLAGLVAAIQRHPGAVLVGHSLGSILIAKLAAHPAASLVGGALLVAPADIERTRSLHDRSFDFGDMPADVLPFPSLVVASRDDVYMSFARAQALNEQWGGALVDLGYAGHINIASGYGRWSDGYALGRQIRGSARNRAFGT